MGPCLEAPVLCWALGLFACLSPLLSICSTLANSPEAQGSGVVDPGGVHSPVNRMQGGSVWFHVIPKSEEMLVEIAWLFSSGSECILLVRVKSGPDSPILSDLQDKFKGRIQVPNMTSLMIENLTSQDSGQYQAQVRHTSGSLYNQVFQLSVYEPVPAPQILVKSPSLMSGWCNITLECRVSGDTKDLNVTWESTGLNGELKHGGTVGPVPNSWILDVSLPMSQPNANLSCVVSNPVDQKSATLHLDDICVLELKSHGKNLFILVQVIRGALLVALLILVAGLYFWKARWWKDKEAGTGRLSFPFPGQFLLLLHLCWLPGSGSYREDSGGGHELGSMSFKN
ncbi:SLAM family member 5-like isoform X3 [Ochotona princeps]|uniref:SLAM family member 5-like isoform X3 n=1 Tax=Ochotona princeps TaxID=9978 RepID=UPI002715345E|nr:SLAM family member 5-like isoform X3 [Ochotona princeps]